MDRTAGAIQVLIGKGDGTFTSAAPVTTPAGPHHIAVADLNGDGKPDMVVTCTAGWATFLGTGPGTFASPTSYTSNDPLYRLSLLADRVV